MTRKKLKKLYHVPKTFTILSQVKRETSRADW